MAQQKTYLRKIRDFGENLGDTMQFIRQEFKPLLGSFVLIAGVFMLGAAIVSGMFQTQFSGIFEDLGKTGGLSSEFFGMFMGRYLLLIVFMLFAMAAMQTVVACYMKLYDQTGTSATVDHVWAEFRKYYLKILVLAFIKLILYMVGLALCVLPGVYLLVVFAPMTWIVVNEDAGIGEAFNRCFALIRQHLWVSLAIYVVAYIIYSFAAGIIGLVLGVFVGVSSYLTTREIDSTVGIVTAVTNIFTYLFYVVFAVSVGLNYYNLTEHSEGVGMMRRLDTLGSQEGDKLTEEQF